jgi:predicted component of type VI protein secretion system
MAQLIVCLRDRELQRVDVTSVVTRIGRDATNDVVIQNDGISRHHATVRYDAVEKSFTIHDDSSSNGLYVRGRPTPYARLVDGDECLLGKFTLRFVKDGGAPLDQLRPDPGQKAPVAGRGGPEPMPTIAIHAAKGRGVSSRPAASSSTPPASATSSRPPPAEGSVSAKPGAADASQEALALQARLMRQMIGMMVILLIVLVVLVALLMRR